MGGSRLQRISPRAGILILGVLLVGVALAIGLGPVKVGVPGQPSYTCGAPLAGKAGNGDRERWGIDTVVSKGAHPEATLDQLPLDRCEHRTGDRLRTATIIAALGGLLAFGALLHRALRYSETEPRSPAPPVAPADGEPAAAARFPHVPALDGVRGLAVLAVLAFHGGVSWATGGFLGVDVFFVLSGYLITSLLLTEWESRGSIALGAFWSRRARRLVPALLLVLVGVGLYARLATDPAQFYNLRLDTLATLGYVANWRFIFAHLGYFDVSAAPSPLRHMWSLAVEEQFYLVWPPVTLLVLATLKSARALFWVATVLTGLSVIVMLVLYAPGTDPSRVYYGTDARAQTVLIGAALAALGPNRRWARTALRRWALVVAGMASAAFVAWTWFAVDGESTFLYQGGLTAIALAVAVVIAASVATKSALGTALSWRPLRAVGLISYGLYLWHWPVFLLLTRSRTGLWGVGLLAVRLLATFGIAILSFVLVERPVRQGAFRHGWAALAAPAAVVVTAAAVLLATVAPATSTPATLFAQRTAVVAPKPEDVTGIIVGDSVAITLAFGIGSRPGLSLGSEARLGCGIVQGRIRGKGQVRQPCGGREVVSAWRDSVAAKDPDVVVVLLGRWDVHDHFYGGRWTHIGEPRYDALLTDRLERGVTALGSRGARVVLLTAPYYDGLERPDGGRWPEDEPERIDRFNHIVRTVAARHRADVTVIDLGKMLSPHGRYATSIDGVKVRTDDGIHLTFEGARMVGGKLLPQLVPLGQQHRDQRLAARSSP